jgi:hypothetical protein
MCVRDVLVLSVMLTDPMPSPPVPTMSKTVRYVCMLSVMLTDSMPPQPVPTMSEIENVSVGVCVAHVLSEMTPPVLTEPLIVMVCALCMLFCVSWMMLS